MHRLEIEKSYLLYSNEKREKGNRGIGLVIVNYFEDFPEPTKRVGAKEELQRLTKLFESFNLEVRPHTELTKDEIIKVLEKTARDLKLSSDSMIAIAISSHGCEEGLLGINIEDRLKHLNDPNYKNMEDCILPTQIQGIFNGKNCPSLARKPKIFLLNGCRGNGIENIVQMEEFDHDGPKRTEELLATTWSDFFVIHSCVPGNISIRSSKVGSLFLIEFSKAYAEYGFKHPIESIMPTVNRNLITICKQKDTLSKQSCTWESTCTMSLLISSTDADRDPMSTQEAFSKQKPSPMSSLSGLVVAKSGEVYVTDPTNECVWKFSNDLNSKVLDIPSEKFSIPNKLAGLHGICIKDPFIFVTSKSGILKLSSKSGQLLQQLPIHTTLTGLDIDDDAHIYVCEQFLCNILVLDTYLNCVRDELNLSVINTKKARLMDIKVFPAEFYVLISGTESVIQMFSKKDGNFLMYIVSSEFLSKSYFFTMDRENQNIFAGDSATSELKAFSDEGRILWKKNAFEENRDEPGSFMGIDINSNNEVVIACICNTKCMIRKFSSLKV